MNETTAKHTYIKSFGYIITKTSYEPENSSVNLNCNFFTGNTYRISGPFINNKKYYNPEDNCIPWLMASGKMQITNLKTGKVEIRTGGESNLKTPEKIGTYQGRCLQPSIVYSIWPENNTKASPTMPKLEYFSLKKDEVYEAPIATKLFLALGSLSVDDDQFNATRSILVTTKPSVLMLALSDCYGFLFE
jgi:hypothetical protein